jgi:hypothetical protein
MQPVKQVKLRISEAVDQWIMKRCAVHARSKNAEINALLINAKNAEEKQK